MTLSATFTLKRKTESHSDSSHPARKLPKMRLSTEEIITRLTLEEKVSLLSGEGKWRTPAIPRLGIKAIKTSDGPNGVRGESIHASTKATCFPCGACLGATFNAELLKEVGTCLGREAKTKNAGVLLGPTINIHRHPHGGRNFESYSEDPILTGELAASYINGLQTQNIAATPKHFVCNESEKERNNSNSIVDEKTLRELYMLPFQICIRKSKPWAMMTAYNKLNGTWCSENNWLIQDVLRKEWGFEGMVMSDWEGTYTDIYPIKAGLNLEMPGPSLHRGAKLIEHVKSGKPSSVSEADIDENIKWVIELAQKVGMENEKEPERAVIDEKACAIARQAAEEGIVLLKNEQQTLPIKPEMKIAVFGAPASVPIIHGGGSSSLSSHYVVTPLAAIEKSFPHVTYRYGVPIFRKIPSASIEQMKTGSGSPGVDCFWYNGWEFGQNLLLHERLDTTRTLVIDPRIDGLQSKHCTRMSFALTPKTSGTHSFGITANGETHLYVDDVEVVSHPGFADTKVEYIMQPGRFEKRATMKMQANQKYHVRIDTFSTVAPPPPPPAFQISPQATQVGFFENLDFLDMAELESVARSSDISIIFTGNNKEYESESFDRETMDLSPAQNQMIATLSAVSSKTVVINQTGGPISMPWIDSVDAVMQNWFAGMEVGNAVAGILSGTVNPSGRLPTTFPKSIKNVPADENFPCDEGLNIWYEEKSRVGYRGLNKADTLFMFGHGLSYSIFQYDELEINRTNNQMLEVEVSVVITNISKIPGKEVVQVYVNGQLKAFTKSMVLAGEKEIISLSLDQYAFSEWDEIDHVWKVIQKEYVIDVRRDAATSILSRTFFPLFTDCGSWKGL